MNSSENLHATRSRTRLALRSRAGLGLATLAVAILIAGCGSSSSSSSIGVGQENKTNETVAKSGGAEATTATATSAPASGPLSKEPTVPPTPGPPPSKLVVKDLIKGTGIEAMPGEAVTLNYVGVLFKGHKEFDATWKRNEPFTFVLGRGQVIPGWDQGVAGMKAGGRRLLIIPSALAYGPKGRPPRIPPNSALVFVVDLLGA